MVGASKGLPETSSPHSDFYENILPDKTAVDVKAACSGAQLCLFKGARNIWCTLLTTDLSVKSWLWWNLNGGI